MQFRIALGLVGLALILVIAAWLQSSKISADPVRKSAFQNLAITFNIAKHGTYSGSAKTSPTMQREPLPNLVLAAWMLLSTPVSEVALASDLNHGESIRRLKLINVFWASGVIVLAFLIVFALTDSVAFSLTAAAVQAPLLLTKLGTVDGLKTELAAACLILATCYLMILVVRNPRGWFALAAGIAAGATALTKAIILYTLPFVALALAMLIYFQLRSIAKGFSVGIIFLVGALFVTAPWIARNVMLFDEPRISSRAGLILYERMLLDRMTNVEYWGSFYVWAPRSVKRLFEATLGYKPSDLEAGGALQRLNRRIHLPDDDIARREGRPELASNYHAMVYAERKQQGDILADRDQVGSTILVERAMEEEARKWIVNHPFDHAALMLPLAWRAMWIQGMPASLALILFLSLLTVPVVGLTTNRPELVAFSLLPIAVFVILIGTTHALPRFAIPLVPAMVISTITLLWLVLPSRLWRDEAKPNNGREKRDGGLNASS